MKKDSDIRHDEHDQHGQHGHNGMDELEKKSQLKILKIKLIIGSIISTILIIGSFDTVAWVPSLFKNKIFMWILATPVQFWIGWQYYVFAFSALKRFKVTMYTLIALGTSVAYFYSVFVIFFEHWFIVNNIPAYVYFESSCVIITFILLGQFLEIRAQGRASSAIRDLVNLQPQRARVLRLDNWVDVSSDVIIKGDIILIKPGEKIPVDGVIIGGESTINESMVTGESMPASKKIGDEVIGATINMTGAFKMRATKVGEGTMLAHIIELVKRAQASKVPIANLVDKIASYFVPLVIIIAFTSGIFWGFYGPEPRLLYAIISVVSVLIIACPCALGLAMPTSIVVAISRGAQEGILVKDAKVFEIAKKINIIVFDKTGTLTTGVQSVKSFMFDDNLEQLFSQLFSQINIKNINTKNISARLYARRIILSVERLSNHPVSVAVVSYLEDKENGKKSKELEEFKKINIKKFETVSGLGVRAFFDTHEVLIGSRKLMEQNSVQMTEQAIACNERWEKEARSISFVAIDKRLIASFCLADSIRPEVKSTIATLKRMGIESVMMTGDNQMSASIVANQVGIKRFFARVLPEDKESYIRKFKAEGMVVAMVGDGINDAPALAAADVGIAIGSGTDIAIESALVALLRSDVSLVPKVITLSHAVMRNIWQNLFWAFGYNIILVPVAAGCLYPLFGVTLSPMIAGAAMSFSSLSVVLNALRLKKVSLN